MQEPLKYYQINWIDGMKINKDHFIGLENTVNDKYKDALGFGIHKFNYGLLPPNYEESGPVKIVLNIDNHEHLHVKIFECRAVTPAGGRIDIHEKTGVSEDFSIPYPETVFDSNVLEQSDLYVAISVNPFNRMPVGNADPDEVPPRQPNVQSEYKVSLIPENQLSKNEFGPFHTLLGKVTFVEGQPQLIKEYIPPCTTVMSHQRLFKLHADFDKFFSQLELDVLKILKKIHEKDQTTSLSRVVEFLAQQIMTFLSNSILEFRWKIPFEPPVMMFEHVARCARVMKNTIDSNSGEAKEELLNYFTDWCSLNQGDFESIVVKTTNFEYDHTNIAKSVDLMIGFAEVISGLFSRLSTLEYIGKKKETSIFVKEQSVKKPPPPPPPKRSFLAD